MGYYHFVYITVYNRTKVCAYNVEFHNWLFMLLLISEITSSVIEPILIHLKWMHACDVISVARVGMSVVESSPSAGQCGSSLGEGGVPLLCCTAA